MKSFFSGTDSSELIENAKHYNYYLSLIVSFDREYKCKIAFPSATKVQYNYSIKNTDGTIINLKSNKDESIVLVGDLEIEMNNQIKEIDWLNNRIEELKKEKNKPTSFQNRYINEEFGSFYDYNWRNKLDKNYSQDLNMAKMPKKDNVDDFLKQLITLDSKNEDLPFNYSIEDAIKSIDDELSMLGEDSYNEYELAIESNMETIHNKVFGETSNFRKNILSALVKLEDFREKYNNNEVFNIIISNLSCEL